MLLSLISHETAIEEMIRTMKDVCWVEITDYVPITDYIPISSTDDATEVKVMFRLRPFMADFAQHRLAPASFPPVVQRRLNASAEDAKKSFLQHWATKPMGTMDATNELQAILDPTQPFDPKVEKAVIRIHKDEKADEPVLPWKIMLAAGVATFSCCLACLSSCMCQTDPKNTYMKATQQKAPSECQVHH